MLSENLTVARVKHIDGQKLNVCMAGLRELVGNF